MTLNSMKVPILLFVFLVLYVSNASSQVNAFLKLKERVVSIGYVDSQQKKFIPEGSGLITYLKAGKNMYKCVITAGHVVKFFHRSGFDCYIRPSWADSIQTTRYFGMKVPVNSSVSMIENSDTTIDLALILFDYDSVANAYYERNQFTIVPHNSIQNAQLGQSLYIYGYPQHVEEPFQKYDYSVCTLKSGIVSWVNSSKLNNILDRYILAESNASFGNSGGPVFNGDGQLVGIQIGIYSDDAVTLQLNGGTVMNDKNSAYYIRARSGVCLVLKAEYIKSFIEAVERYLIANP